MNDLRTAFAEKYPHKQLNSLAASIEDNTSKVFVYIDKIKEHKCKH